MDIEYLSNHEEATFANLMAEDNELITLFAFFASEMDEGSDYKSLLVSFDGPRILRASVCDSPYLVIFNQEEQQIILQQLSDDGVPAEDSVDNLDEDGAETIADIICSRYVAEEGYFV